MKKLHCLFGLLAIQQLAAQGTMHTCGAEFVHNGSLTYGELTDQDGNDYKTIVIGSNEWMAENLITGHYANGDQIYTFSIGPEWDETINGAWCWYNNDSANYACPFGKLYNWYAVNDDRGLCPAGWHVPSADEYASLRDYVDGSANGDDNEAGIALKSTGTISVGNGYWEDPNTGAANSSGFSMLPGGYRDQGDGAYADLGYYGNLWTSTAYNDVLSTSLNFLYDWDGIIFYNDPVKYGLSVRCVRPASGNSIPEIAPVPRFYPNPASGQITIDLGATPINAQPTMRLFDLTGNLAYSANLLSKTNTISSDLLPASGIYLMQVIDKDGTTMLSEKVVFE
ncbi:MAG: T9SS type A sorting domain-containing protein [Flavobacteriales bacterium]|nr:T9SS type A sorting domain-containing protein [Flavobacteriales bacterium]